MSALTPWCQKVVGANTPEDPDVHLQTSTADAAVLAGQVANLLTNLSHPTRFLRTQLPAIG